MSETELREALRDVLAIHDGTFDGSGYVMVARLANARLLASIPAEPEQADDLFVVCGIDGCDFAVERGEGRTMALHKSEDHARLAPARDDASGGAS